MKVKLTYTITVTEVQEVTDGYGYTNKQDLDAIVADNQKWLDDGSLSLLDVIGEDVKVVVTGEVTK